MPLFFILSGMVLHLKSRRGPRIQLKEQLARLSKRLLLPYFLWGAVYTGMQLAYWVLRGDEDVLRKLLVRCYTIVTGRVAPLWFLYSLFMAEAAFFVLWKALSGDKAKWSAGKWTAVAALAAAATVAGDSVYKAIDAENMFWLLQYPIMTLFRFFPAFFFLTEGFLMAWLLERHPVVFRSRAVVALAAAVSAAAFFALEHVSGNHANMHLFAFGSPAVFLLTGTFGSAAVILAVMLLPAGIRPLSALGRRSMDIMALHYYGPMPFMIIFVYLEERLLERTIVLAAAAAAVLTCYEISLRIVDPLRRAGAELWRRARGTAG